MVELDTEVEDDDGLRGRLATECAVLKRDLSGCSPLNDSIRKDIWSRRSYLENGGDNRVEEEDARRDESPAEREDAAADELE